jgi:hypothetical protein
MDDYLNFDTYLYISSKKFTISVNTETKKKIYDKDLTLKIDIKQIDLDILDNFLNENIFKIEKLLKNFVKNIYLIIDCEEFFPIDISLKKKNYGEFITIKNVNYILNEAKDQCSNTLNDKKIIHILIDKYLIDDKKFLNLPQNLKCNHFSLDINLICLPLNYLKKIENILSKYQISIKRVISMKYLESLFLDQNVHFSDMAEKIVDGHNLNEVVLSSKKSEKPSFFEKFFHFFS